MEGHLEDEQLGQSIDETNELLKEEYGENMKHEVKEEYGENLGYENVNNENIMVGSLFLDCKKRLKVY